jgi:hypothetical protein
MNANAAHLSFVTLFVKTVHEVQSHAGFSDYEVLAVSQIFQLLSYTHSHKLIKKSLAGD